MRPISDILAGGYEGPRALARAGDPRALDEVARQFEAYLLQQMLKSMRDASLGDPLLGSDDTKLYRDLFDRRLSLELAAGKGIGFADVMKLQLAGPGSAAPARPGVKDASPLPLSSARPSSAYAGVPAPASADGRHDRAASTSALGGATAPAPAPRGSAVPRAAESLERGFESPEAFVARLWPHAQAAGAALGVSPHLLLAQSALETGWGKHVVPGPDGAASSRNLFGIKADARWSGPRVVKRTLEYEDGVMKRVDAPFRAYSSFAESFEDYVRFIEENPRYRDALERRASPEEYMRALQTAGYATDPHYAEKVLGLLEREPIRQPSTRI